MPGRKPKQKGNRVERFFVKLFQNYGWKARRMYGSSGRSCGLDDEVDIIINEKEPNEVYAQVKSKKKMPQWMSLKNVKWLLIKEDREEPLIMMRLHDYLGECDRCYNEGKE
jgi:Holliday junction resolvase